ncbi:MULTISPECIES: hypothetical protein [Eisenbergiella]|nr:MULTISPECIES: hypothetical protein [Eisenbergiella]MDY5528413.1 hypothetical protein [Eisenbergiella porci]
MDKFLKILDFVLVIAAIVLAVYVGKNIGLISDAGQGRACYPVHD